MSDPFKGSPWGTLSARAPFRGVPFAAALRDAVSQLPTQPDFDPATLFAAGEIGVWYDVGDLTTMFQDTAGTIAAAVDQPVALIQDKSGNLLHATQATAASQPILRQDVNENYYLEFDGVDDFLVSGDISPTLAQPWDRISGLQQNAWVGGDRIFEGKAVTSAMLIQLGASPALVVHDGVSGPSTSSLALSDRGVVTERHNTTASQIAINNEAYVTADSGTGGNNGISMGARSTGANASAIHLYGVIMRDGTMTADQVTGSRDYQAWRAGVIM